MGALPLSALFWWLWRPAPLRCIFGHRCLLPVLYFGVPLVAHSCVFGPSGSVVNWSGHQLTDGPSFVGYLRGPVHDRLFDVDNRERLEADMRALATSDMANDTLNSLLASEPPHLDWEVGEALAEYLLGESGCSWPWNSDRDRRTPKASLPGADLVGFIGSGADTRLAIGEVKTSNDASAPPGVMYGRSGMIHQLDALASKIDIHMCLIRWLHARCKNTEYWESFQTATERYLNSEGRDLALFGVLVRDTTPNELDLRNRADALSSVVQSPTKVQLTAWYLPRPISELVSLAAGGTDG